MYTAHIYNAATHTTTHTQHIYTTQHIQNTYKTHIQNKKKSTPATATATLPRSSLSPEPAPPAAPPWPAAKACRFFFFIIYKVPFCVAVYMYHTKSSAIYRDTKSSAKAYGILRKAVSYIYLYVCVCIHVVSGRFPEGNHCKRTLYKHTCTTYMYINHIIHYQHACTSKDTTHTCFIHTRNIRNIHHVLHINPQMSYTHYKHTCLYFT